ncbi:secreted frizzled-related protein 5-like [Salminus brasiliensis]|uniref:secreted frizzled-related protein 5-like n=1 Tax=Salminus brasiliensis TaxID=930266 RepID=UPI003B82C998
MQSSLSSISKKNVPVLAEDRLETSLTKVELAQLDKGIETIGNITNLTRNQSNISANDSLESINSSYRNTPSSKGSGWHADRSNSTQYSPEYSVSNNLLTAGSDRSFLASPSPTAESPRCLPVDSDLPFCSRMGVESFAVPNFLNQSSVEEVEALLREWAWLLRSGCHHGTEWFFCLLVVPRCGPPGLPPQLPCRSFCELLIDSCWMLLGGGSRFPVDCSSLPEESDDGYQCLSVSTQKVMGSVDHRHRLSLMVKRICFDSEQDHHLQHLMNFESPRGL